MKQLESLFVQILSLCYFLSPVILGATNMWSNMKLSQKPEAIARIVCLYNSIYDIIVTIWITRTDTSSVDSENLLHFHSMHH